MAYDALEPIGGKRGDWHAATICAATMNAALLARTGDPKPVFKAEEFLLRFRDPDDVKKEAATTKEKAKKPAAAPAQPWQSMKMYARMHAALANAKPPQRVKRKR